MELTSPRAQWLNEPIFNLTAVDGATGVPGGPAIDRWRSPVAGVEAIRSTSRGMKLDAVLFDGDHGGGLQPMETDLFALIH